MSQTKRKENIETKTVVAHAIHSKCNHPKRKKAEPRSDRARNWKENLHDLPEPLLNEVVREIDRQEGNIETKTLAQIANKCSLLNHMCKNCLGECEFEGTPTFLGKWVSEAEHRAKIERLKVKMYNQARTEIEEATRKDIFDLQNKLAKAEADYNFLHDCCMEWADLKRVLEGENAKLKNEIAEERTGNEFLNTENLALMGDCVAYQKRLEAIKSPEMLEKLAKLEHEQWSGWIKYMESLKVIIDVPIREMWLKLACLPYEKLTEKGKESDRKFARKVLGVLLSKPKNEKFRCSEFGNPNMSDTCSQCPSNHECCEEWWRKEGMNRKARERNER